MKINALTAKFWNSKGIMINNSAAKWLWAVSYDLSVTTSDLERKGFEDRVKLETYLLKF